MKLDNDESASFEEKPENVLAAEAYLAAMTHTPTMFLTETCEVIDVSEKFRSCCADNADRTFLGDIMGDNVYDSFKKFCSGKSCVSKVFSIGYKRYRYAVGIKPSDMNGRCIMVCLADKVKAAWLLMGLLERRMSVERFTEFFYSVSSDVELFARSFRMLTDPYNEMDEWESTAFLRNFAGRLSLRSDLFPFKIKFADGDSVRTHKIRVHSGGLSLIFSCAVSVLGPLSKSGELSVAFDLSPDSYGVTVSAVLPCDVKLRGETDRITSLGDHVAGSFPFLAIAEIAAAETDMYVRLKSEKEKLSFTFGSRIPAVDSHGFNYRDPELAMEGTVIAVLAVLAVLDVLRASVNE